jgi:hypothetical protein
MARARAQSDSRRRHLLLLMLRALAMFVMAAHGLAFILAESEEVAAKIPLPLQANQPH